VAYLQIIFWTGAGFLLGSVPFSVLLSRGLGGEDPRVQADGNPGAFNAWKSAGWKAGIPAILLDFFKGAIPVGTAFYGVGISGISLLPVALAPILGHAFSPFLRFRGGKSLAVTFGVWAGLTFGEGALVLGLFFGLFYVTAHN
jgi:glycerol-3-phosphate acyltransferase PlsY